MTPLRTPPALAALLAGLLLCSGCGGQPSSASKIQDDTAAVVRAMNAKDYPAARSALATLDSDLAAAGRLERLEAGTVASLRAGVATLKADLAAVSPTPSASPSPHRTTAPPPPKKKKHGKHDD